MKYRIKNGIIAGIRRHRTILMKRSLTDAKVKNLKPQDKGYKVKDGGGMYVYVAKTGTRSFRYDANLGGKRFTMTFGTYPDISLAEARELHEEAHRKVKNGKDPRETAPESRSFSYYAIEQMNTLDLRESTYKKRLGRMQKYLFATLDKKDVTAITALDLLNLLKPIAETGKRESARRLASYCSQTFDYLLSLQLIENNPAESVRRILPKEKRSTNFAHLTDVDDLKLFLRALETHTGDYSVKMALKLMPLVFLRPINLRLMRWEYVDLKNKLITFPAEQMKMNKELKVPLSTQAIKILKEMKNLTGKLEYVFMSARSMNSDHSPLTENTLNVAITRLKNPVTKEPFGRGFITSHGIRHTASTRLNELGFNADAIELQLAHAPSNGIRAVYNKAELLPERTAMMQRWADYLDAIKNG